MVNSVGTALNSIKGMSYTFSGATGLLDSKTIEAYAKAINGLSLNQAQFVLSTKSMTDAQKEQILVGAGLITKEEALSGVAVERALSEAGLSSALREQILGELGLWDAKEKQVIASNNVTLAEVKEAVATTAGTEAKEAAVGNSLKVTAANGVEAFSWEALATTIGTATKELLIFLTTNPVGWAIMIGSATLIAINAYNNFNEELQESIENSKKLKEEYSRLASDTDKNIKSLIKQKKEYDELSEGVGEYGENISLSADKYERYKNIVSEVLGYSPDLIAGYDAEGNAIVRKNGLIEKSIELMKTERLQRLKELTSSNNTKNLYRDVRGNYVASKVVKALPISASLNVEKFAGFNSALENVVGKTNEGNLYDYLEQNEAIISNNYDAILARLKNAGMQAETARDVIRSLKEAYGYIRDVRKQEHSFDEQFFLYAESAESYENLTDAQRNFVNEYIKNTGKITDANGNALDEEQILQMGHRYKDFAEGLASDPSMQEARNKINDLYALNANDISFDDYAHQRREMLNELDEALVGSMSDESRSSLIDSLWGNLDELVADYNNAYSKTVLKFGLDENQITEFKDFLRTNHINTKEALAQWLDIINTSDSYREAVSSYWENISPANKDLKAVYDYNKALQENKKILDSYENGDYKKKNGNIDHFNRPVIEWTEEEIEKQREAAQKWVDDINKRDKEKNPTTHVDIAVEDEFQGKSTVYGGTATFGDNGEYRIAYTPIIDDGTGKGELLTPDNLNKYINDLLKKATKDGKVDFDKVLELDAEGSKIDGYGKKIKNVIGDIALTAESTDEDFVALTQSWHEGEQAIYDVKAAEDKLVKAANAANTSLALYIDQINDKSFKDFFNLGDNKTPTTLGNISKGLDDVQNAYKTLKGAVQEYNKEGYLSVDTFQSVIGLGGKYLQFLFDENGNLNMNEDALKRVALARVEEIRLKAIDGAVSVVENIKSETEALSYIEAQNFSTAESYQQLAEDRLKAWTATALTNGIPEAKISDVLYTVNSQIQNINSLSEKTAKGIKKGFGMTGDSAKDAGKKVDDINDKIKDLNDQQALADLKYSIETVNQELEQTAKILERIDRLTDLTFESDFTTKLQNAGQQFLTASRYGGQMREEMERLLAIEPQSASEAEELASSLESLSDKFFDNEQKILEYRNTMYDTVLEFQSAYVDHLNERNDAVKGIVDDTLKIMERGSLTGGFWSRVLLPSVSKDKVKQQRNENNKLVAEEKHYQDAIAKIRRQAIDMAKAEEDEARAKQRAEYEQELAEASSSFTSAVTGMKDTALEATDEVTEGLNGVGDTLDSVTDKVGNLANALRQIPGTINPRQTLSKDSNKWLLDTDSQISINGTPTPVKAAIKSDGTYSYYAQKDGEYISVKPSSKINVTQDMYGDLPVLDIYKPHIKTDVSTNSGHEIKAIYNEGTDGFDFYDQSIVDGKVYYKKVNPKGKVYAKNDGRLLNAKGGITTGTTIVNDGTGKLAGREGYIGKDGKLHWFNDEKNIMFDTDEVVRVISAPDMQKILSYTGDKYFKTPIGDLDSVTAYAEGNTNVSFKTTSTTLENTSADGAAKQILSETDNAFKKLKGKVSLNGLKDVFYSTVSDKRFSKQFAQKLSTSIDGSDKDFGKSLKGLIIQNSAWEDIPSELQDKFKAIGASADNWGEWISNSDNTLQAFNIMEGSGASSWDFLGDSITSLLQDYGIDGKEAWDAFIEENPMEALQLLLSSWDSLEMLVQQYMDDCIAIATNGAEAIHAIKIESPDISQESWDALQTLIANKIQEILNVINETFGANTVDLNFSINTDLKTAPTQSGAAFGSGGSVPYYNQGDYADYIYGSGSMKDTACGPTSMAMVLSGLTGKNISPVEAAHWSQSHGHYVSGHGTDWGFFNAMASEYGIKSQTISYSADNLRNALSSGNIVITSMAPGHFTRNGHFVVLTGLTPDGQVMVNDPGSRERTHAWDLNTVANEAVQAWAFSAYASGTSGAQAGDAILGDEGLQKGDTKNTYPELVFSKSTGKAFLAGLNGAEMVRLGAGDTVVPYSDTRKFLANGGFNAYAKGTKNASSMLVAPSVKNNDVSSNVTRIDVPKGLGKYTTYMHWRSVTAKDSLQYKLRQDSGEQYSPDGFGIINGRVVLAMTSTFGGIGDYVDVHLSDGRVLQGIIGDEKSQSFTPWDNNPANKWGHENGNVIIEYVVAPGWNKGNPSLNGASVDFVENLGNYWGNPTFSGGANGTFFLNPFAQKLQEALQKIQTLMGTFKTNTHVSKSLVAAYKSLGDKRGSYDFDANFTAHANGTGDYHIVGENGKPEIMRHKHTGKMSVVDSPMLFDPNEYDVIGEDTTAKYLKSAHMYANGTVSVSEDKDENDEQIISLLNSINKHIEGEEKLSKEDNKFSIDELTLLARYLPQLKESQTVTVEKLKDYLRDAKGEKADTEKAIEAINEHLPKDHRLKYEDFTYTTDEYKSLERVLSTFEEDEKVNPEKLDSYLEYGRAIGDFEDWIEDELDDLLNVYTTEYVDAYMAGQKEYRDWQNGFSKKFVEFTKNPTEGNYMERYSQLATEASDRALKVVEDQTKLEVDVLKNSAEQLKKQREVAEKLYHDAPTPELQKKAIENLNAITEAEQDIDEKYADAISSLGEQRLARYQNENLGYDSRTSFLERDITKLDRQIDKASDTAEKSRLLEEKRQKISSQSAIAEEKRAHAHQTVMDEVYNSQDEDIQKLLQLIKVDEAFDANGEFNDVHKNNIAMLNSSDELSALVPVYENMMNIIQEGKKTWVECTDAIDDYSDALDDIDFEEAQSKIEVYTENLERLNEIDEVRKGKQDAITAAMQQQHSLAQSLREETKNITAELDSITHTEQWLDEDTREIIFNKVDYDTEMKAINDIQAEASRLYRKYQHDIASLNETEWFKEQKITDEYNKQMDILNEKLEVSKQEIALKKKELEYNNALKERDTRIIIGGRSVQVANPDTMYNLAKERSQAQSDLNNTLLTNKETEQERQSDRISQSINQEIETRNKMVELIGKMSDAEQELFAATLPVIQELEVFKEALSPQNIPWLNAHSRDFRDDFVDMPELYKHGGYNQAHDYAGDYPVIEQLYKSGVIRDEVYEALTQQAENQHNWKRSTDVNTAQYPYTSNYGDVNYGEEYYGINDEDKLAREQAREYQHLVSELNNGKGTQDTINRLKELNESNAADNKYIANVLDATQYTVGEDGVAIRKEELETIGEIARGAIGALENAIIARGNLSSDDKIAVRRASDKRKQDKEPIAHGNFNQYANGIKSSKEEWAITDENGYEAKFEQPIKGKYTPLPEGTWILTAQQTENLAEWSNINPASTFMDGIKKMTQSTLQSVNTVNNNQSTVSNSYNIEHMSIEDPTDANALFNDVIRQASGRYDVTKNIKNM